MQYFTYMVAYELPFLGKSIASVLSYPLRVDLLFFIFSDGSFVVLKENLWQILDERERAPGPKEYVPTEGWPQWKAESRIELQLYCTSSLCHIQPLSIQRSLVVVLLLLLVAAPSSFNLEKITVVNSSFLFLFPLGIWYMKLSRVGPLRW